MSTLASEVSYEFLRQKCVERAAQTEQGTSDPEPSEFLLPGEEPEPEIREGSFVEQAQIWLQSLSKRRKPVKPATLNTWSSIVRAHVASSVVLGNTLLANTDNQTLREFVDELVDKELGARSIRDILLVAKLILKSAKDSRGNLLFKWEFNHDHINAPVVGEANAPCAKREDIEVALRRVSEQHQALIICLAASGLRLGEALAVCVGSDDNENSFWDGQAIHVRKSVWRGVLQSPKTRAAVRIVDLCSEANAALAKFAGNRTGFLFASRNRTPLSPTTFYKHGLAKTRLAGAHSLRRFRATRLGEAEVPMPLVKFWLGHAGESMSEKYMRPGEMASRKEWCERSGLGFSL